MKTTSNYGLKKPEKTDFALIEDLNANADIIDAKLKELESSNKSIKRITDLRVASTAWEDDTSVPGYAARTDIPVEGIDDDWMCFEGRTSDPSRVDLYQEVDTMNNALRIWIKTKPDHEIVFESFSFVKIN